MARTEIPKDILDLPLEVRAEMALKAAVKKAIAELIQDGSPVYILRDDKVVDISEEIPAEELQVPDTKPGAAHTASEVVGFLSEGETGERNGLAVAHDFDAQGRLGFGAGLAQDSEGSQRFAVDFSDEKIFPAGVSLPDLANLDFAGSHGTTVDTNWPSVNGCRPPM